MRRRVSHQARHLRLAQHLGPEREALFPGAEIAVENQPFGFRVRCSLDTRSWMPKTARNSQEFRSLFCAS